MKRLKDSWKIDGFIDIFFLAVGEDRKIDRQTDRFCASQSGWKKDRHTSTYGQNVNITIQLQCNTFTKMHYAYPMCSLCIFFIISLQHLKVYTKCYANLEMVCYLCIELIIYMWPLLHQLETRFNCKVFKYEFDFVFSLFSLNTPRALAYFH